MIYPSITTGPAWRGYITVPKSAGGVRHYNGSACRFEGKIYHAWRNESADGHSCIWMGELKGTKITKAKKVELGEGFDAEDPRLFEWDGHLWLGWAKVRDTRHDCGNWSVEQWLASLSPDGTVTGSGPWAPDMIQIGPVEKNWTPLPDGGLFYDFGKGISLSVNGALRNTGTTRMPWGTLWGGTPAIEWPERGTWLAFYHGSAPHSERVKRYYFGALEIEPATHRIIRMSRTPLVWASDEDPTIVCPREATYNPSVVFPTGLFRGDDGLFYVTGGVHDSRDALWAFDEAMLCLVDKRTAEITTRVVVEAGDVPPAGHSIVRVIAQGINEGGRTYKRGECFAATPGRIAALGALVETV